MSAITKPVIPSREKKAIRKLYPNSPNGLPTEDDLPCGDDQPMESQEHLYQLELLMDPLEISPAYRDWYIGGDMLIHFILDDQVKKGIKKFRGPDVMVVKGGGRRLRKSWVVWQEGKPPDVIIELLSRSTRQVDRGVKKEVYSRHLRTPEYYIFDPKTKALEPYTLRNGEYLPITPDSQGRIVSQELGLALVLWTGPYKTIQNTWLRWAALDGTLLPTAEEIAAQRQQELQQQAAILDQVWSRADRLADKLRSLGLDPDE